MYWEAAGGADLNGYGDFANIDHIALVYNYTHAEAFSLSWSELMTIIVLGRRRAAVEYRYHELRANESHSR